MPESGPVLTAGLRIAEGERHRLELRLFDAAGDPENADAPPTIEVYRDGELVAGPSASAAQAAGVYAIDLAGATTLTLGELRVVWTLARGAVAEQYVEHREVVGRHVTSLAQLRRLDPIDDEVKYSDAEVLLARDVATYALEHECNTAFARRRSKLAYADVFPFRFVALRHTRDLTIVSAIVDTVALTDDERALIVHSGGGLLSRDAAGFGKTGMLAYEYGYDFAPARPARAIGLLAAEWAQENVGDSPIPQRAVMVTTDAGTTRFVTAGEFGRAFDLPEVNAVVRAYSE